MSQIITLISNKKGVGSTTVAFNLANLLKLTNRKILLVDLDFSPSYKKYIKVITEMVKPKYTIAPFVCVTYAKNFQILFLSSELANSKNVSVAHYDKLLSKQIEDWRETFDYIIFDVNSLWYSLNKIALKLSNVVVPICDADSFSSADVFKTLNNVRSIQKENAHLELQNIILNNFNRQNVRHISNLATLKKIFNNDNCVTILPYTSELVIVNDKSLNYAKDEQWSDYALALKSLTDKLRVN